MNFKHSSTSSKDTCPRYTLLHVSQDFIHCNSVIVKYCRPLLFIHMQVQSNVKVLTTERDRINNMYEDVSPFLSFIDLSTKFYGDIFLYL